MAADDVTPVAGAAGEVATLRPAEFCALERQLVAGMAMRKKRHVEIGPVQQLKIQLLEHVEAADPDPANFTAALGEAVITVSSGPGTGPAQAVASVLRDCLATWGISHPVGRLSISDDAVIMRAIQLPPMRRRDVRPALEYALDREIPFPAEKSVRSWSLTGRNDSHL